MLHSAAADLGLQCLLELAYPNTYGYYHVLCENIFFFLQSLEDEVNAHQAEFESMKETAQDISRSTGDGRTASYAGQLFSRYQTLADAVRVGDLK